MNIKSIEWLKEEFEKLDESAKNYGGNVYRNGYRESLAMVKSKVEELESELPAIPDYVAEWLDSNKIKYKSLLHFSTYYVKGEVQASVYSWILSNPDTFARAWLDGFTIEVKKYCVAVDHENGDWTYASDGRNIFKTRFKTDAIQLAKLLGGRVIRYEEEE